MLGGIVADAAAAAHEDHADIGDVDHRHAVMAGAAWQFMDLKTFGGDGLGHLPLQPRRARHGAVLVGDVDLQRQLPVFGDAFDPAHDIGNRAPAMGIGRGPDIHGERDFSRNDVGGAGQRVDIPDSADQAVRIGAAKLLDRDDALGGASERIVSQRHRHGSGVAGGAGQACRQPGRA